MKHLLSILLILLLWNLSSSAQTFVDVSNATGFSILSQSSGWGNGVSFFDVDEDGWDDLTVCVAGAPTRFYKNNSGYFELHTVFFNDQESKACIWLDIDEDGDNDLFVSRFNASDQLYLNQGNLVFGDVSSNISNLHSEGDFSWGASFGDYTRDGFLDICVGNYGTAGAANVIGKNTGQSSFQAKSIPPATTTLRTSFQPIWLDLNQDLFQDLFTINDHYQGNEYYTHSTLDVFEDKSIISGLNIPSSSMSNSWCDYDRDGDMDLYITNTMEGNRLMVNDGENVFSDHASAEGVVLNVWSWSALWLDADNDGWNDLHVASKDLVNTFAENNLFFKNNQGSLESQGATGLSGLPYGAYSSAKGDFNNDGKIDVVMLTEMNTNYKLFQNTTATGNNFFKFRLNGRLSNRNGVGTHYVYWVNGVKDVGYTYCGEGFLTQNSQNIILGLGLNNTIDSLRLYWLSGVEDIHYNLTANTFQIFTEGETKPVIEASKDEICQNGDSIILSILDWPVVMWENGSFNPNRTITSSGNYSAIVSTGFGHSLTLSKQILNAQVPSITTEIIHPTCAGTVNGEIHCNWMSLSDTITSYSLNLSPGTYNLSIPYGEDCITTLSVDLIDPLPLDILVSPSSVSCFGEASGLIEFEITGGVAPYDMGEGNSFVLSDLVAGEYAGIVTDANGCESSWNAMVDEPSPLVLTANTEMPSAWNDGSIVLTVEGGAGNYSYDWSNGNLTAENLNLQDGEYFVTVTDGNGCVADTTFSLIFNYVNSLNLNTMNWTLHKGGLHYDGSETLHHVFVYDAVGKLLHREQIMAGHTTIPMDAAGPLFILSHEGNWKSSVYTE